MTNRWPEERIEKLVGLWPTESASAIGKLLGCTRCSVIGKARRLKLMTKKMGFPLGASRQKPPPQPPKYKIISPAVIPITAPPIALRHSNPVPLMEAKEFQCRAIVEGKDNDGLVMVCGNHIEPNQNFSFCAEHLQLYTTKGYAR